MNRPEHRRWRHECPQHLEEIPRRGGRLDPELADAPIEQVGPECRGERLGIGDRLAIDPESFVGGAEIDAPPAETLDEGSGCACMLVPRLRAVPEEKEHGGEIVGDLRRCGH